MMLFARIKPFVNNPFKNLLAGKERKLLSALLYQTDDRDRKRFIPDGLWSDYTRLPISFLLGLEGKMHQLRCYENENPFVNHLKELLYESYVEKAERYVKTRNQREFLKDLNELLKNFQFQLFLIRYSLALSIFGIGIVFMF